MKGESEINYQLILEAARMLKNNVNPRDIAKQLHISNKDIGVARELMNMSIIMFDDKGEPYYTMSEVELEPLVRDLRRPKDKRSLPPVAPASDMDVMRLQREGIAKTNVDSTVEERISRKAVEMTEATYRLGDAVRMYFEDYCEYMGLKPEDARPELVIPEVFERAKRYDKLEKEVQELRLLVNELQNMTDPFFRLEKSIDMLADFLYARLITKRALGVDIARTEVGKFYATLIAAYLTGGVESEEENPTGGVER